MSTLSTFIQRYKRRQIIAFLKAADPEKLARYGERLLIPAFRRAAKLVPAYRQILKENNVDWRQIKNTDSFKRLVPVISKTDVFARFEIDQICAGASLKDMKLAMSSSGFSGTYSFGINTNLNYKRIAQSIDTALDYVFDISRRHSFLINCIPMGVKVHSSLQISENSVRSDMALAIIKKFSHKFQQTLIVSDPHFLKKLAEEGNAEKIPWKKLNISLISGEDWFSESFRSYLAGLIDLDIADPKGRLIGATMGIAELDLNLFHESIHTINLRRKLQENPGLMKGLLGQDTTAAPLFFHYYPHRIFLEALPESSPEKELVFSMLSPYMLIPLIRYNCRDRGWIFSYNQIKDFLTQINCPELTPDLKLPLVAVGGRKDRFLESRGQKIYPEEIKQGLYEDFEAAGLTTGYFRLNKQLEQIEIQLRKGIVNNGEITSKLQKALLKYISVDLPVKVYPYQEFPYAMELDYERKFQSL